MRISRPLPIAIGFSLILLTGVADATSTTCTTTVVCAEYINSSSGVAIHGEANSGIGIRGTSNTSTGFYGASRSGATLFPGVEGESLNQTGDDVAGAFGLTAQTGGTAPAYGVLAYGSVYGVDGNASGGGNGQHHDAAPTAAGVAGIDTSGAANSDTNVGVLGTSRHGYCAIDLANTTNVEAPFGDYPVGMVGDAEPEQTNGQAVGIEGISNDLALVAYNPKLGTEVNFAVPSYLITASNNVSGSAAFSVDNSGNVNAKSLTTTKGSYARTTGTSGTARTLYAPHTTAPVTEDFGEGQLVNGRGYVRLDPALADVIDGRSTYYVFITPEGDSDGLYVTQKSLAGFTVRESRGGHSTLAFQYRILAKPVDEDGKRLALAPPLPHDAPIIRHAPAAGAAAAATLDPFARLKLRLGPAAYERALKAARLVETAR
jgi:hypothetical protein